MRNGVSLLVVFSFAALSWMTVAADGGHKDGYSVRGGKVVMLKGGHESFVTAEISFRNGSRLLPDGFLVFGDGRRERFEESRWVTLDGDDFVVETAYDDFDGYWYEGGHVYVMRDRRPTIVIIEITLGDGSRLSPDGTIILRDGTRNRFTEGQRISKEGKTVAAKTTTAAKTPAATAPAAPAPTATAPVTPVAPAKSVDASHKTETPVAPRQPETREKAPAPVHEKAQAPAHEKAQAPEHEKAQAPEKKQDAK